MSESLYIFCRIEKAHEDLQVIAKALRDKKANNAPEDPTKYVLLKIAGHNMYFLLGGYCKGSWCIFLYMMYFIDIGRTLVRVLMIQISPQMPPIQMGHHPTNMGKGHMDNNIINMEIMLTGTTNSRQDMPDITSKGGVHTKDTMVNWLNIAQHKFCVNPKDQVNSRAEVGTIQKFVNLCAHA